MTLQIAARKLTCSTSLFVVLFVAMPVCAAPLTGTGTHLSIPSPNPAWPPGESVARVATGTGFTGTWAAPVQPNWVGTFSATGPIPSSMSSGATGYDFSSLPLGYLPAGTFFVFGDVDSGSTLEEQYDLRAFDSSNNLISNPWLDDTYAVRGPGTGTAGAVTTNDMPGWSWNAPATPDTYVINGSTITGGNPNVAFALASNQPIYAMELDKVTTHNGFVLQAPTVPEPSSVALLIMGVGAIIAKRRKHLKHRP